MKKIREVQEVMEEKQEEVEIIPGYPGKTIKIAQDLELAIRDKFLICLKKNADIFASSSVATRNLTPRILA